MAVAQLEFNKVYRRYPSARILKLNAFKSIDCVSLRVKGLVGGRGFDASRTIHYMCVIDTRNLRSSQIPEVFFSAPDDSQIKHVNIFHPRYCSLLARQLPELCWGGDNVRHWSDFKVQNRQLFAVVRMIEGVLMQQNFGSPAR